MTIKNKKEKEILNVSIPKYLFKKLDAHHYSHPSKILPFPLVCCFSLPFEHFPCSQSTQNPSKIQNRPYHILHDALPF